MICLFEAKKYSSFFVPDFFLQNNKRKNNIFNSLILGVSAPSLPLAVGNGTTPTRNKTKEKGKKGKAKLPSKTSAPPLISGMFPRLKLGRNKY